MRRKFNLILQAKGGVGKSLHTYLRALSEKDKTSLFVDLDSSTQTSTRQLAFLGDERLETISLIDNRDMLVRDLFIGYIESLMQTPFDEIFMDFGAPESEQFPALVSRDLDFKEWCDEVDADAVFHIIIGGGGAYRASVEYLQKMIEVLEGKFRILVWENVFSFRQFSRLSEELANNCAALGLEHIRFGDFEANSLLGSQILDGIRNGFPLENYGPGARLRLKKEIRESFCHA
ncbi:hypothetical protein [Dyadobacter sp. CY326]|uniref:hypothetical protein n=1 Tax=Dyadobacter sp. CY326 TaxID=2907300 RepID=UPI001F381DA1|nr:hypothetical protein [Dyadobacter sp. CY326]MCE7066676.1 hypothetical protein [Dyadobacter sp. CY326]